MVWGMGETEAPWPTRETGNAAEAYRRVAIDRSARVEELMTERVELAEYFATLCQHRGYEPHQCSVLIAAHDVARIIRGDDDV